MISLHAMSSSRHDEGHQLAHQRLLFLLPTCPELMTERSNHRLARPFQLSFGKLQKLDGQISVSAGDFTALRVHKDSVQTKKCVVGRNEKICIECDRSRRMECIGGTNPSGLQMELL